MELKRHDLKYDLVPQKKKTKAGCPIDGLSTGQQVGSKEKVAGTALKEDIRRGCPIDGLSAVDGTASR